MRAPIPTITTALMYFISQSFAPTVVCKLDKPCRLRLDVKRHTSQAAFSRKSLARPSSMIDAYVHVGFLEMGLETFCTLSGNSRVVRGDSTEKSQLR